MAEADGLFKRNYPEVLQEGGKDWLRRLPAEERRVFASLGRLYEAEHDINWQQAGGKKRAATAQRYPKGHERAGQYRPGNVASPDDESGRNT